MTRQKRYHYIPMAYQRLFADEANRIAYLPRSGEAPRMAGIKDCFVLKEGDTPFFNERTVTSVEREMMDPITHLHNLDDAELLPYVQAVANVNTDPSELALAATGFTSTHQKELCLAAVVQALRQPTWRQRHVDYLRQVGITQRQFVAQATRAGKDPCFAAAEDLLAGTGLSVVRSRSAEFVFGSHLMTQLGSGDILIPAGRHRAFLLTADKRYCVEDALPPTMASYNKQNLMWAEYCGTHPTNTDYLVRHARLLGRRQGLQSIELPTEVRDRLAA